MGNSQKIATRQRVLGAVLSAIALTFAAACGQGGDDALGPSTDLASDLGPEGDQAWQELVEAAKEEGEVTYYVNYPAQVANELAERFEDTYGISVRVVRDVDATLQQRFEAEQTTGRVEADLISSTTVAWMEGHATDGAFVEPEGPAFYETDYDADELIMEGGPFVSSTSVATYGWNTDRYPAGLTGYEDLLNPDLANGQVGIIQPMSGAIVDFYDYIAQQEGEDFLSKLAEQAPRIYPGTMPMAEALIAGEISASIYVRDQTVPRENGAPVDNGLPEEIWGARYMTAIVNDSTSPNAAQLLANFMISPAGQEALAFEGASVIPGIDGAIAEIGQIADQDPEVVTPARQDEFRQEFDQLFS